nr:MAG TPA: hypothetical protein [Caudoviricetes sp.]
MTGIPALSQVWNPVLQTHSLSWTLNASGV